MKKSLITLVVAVFLPSTTILSQIDEAKQDAVFLEVEKRYHLNEDGSWRLDYAHRVKLLTYQAVTRGLGETFIVFNPQYQTLTIDKSVTTMTDGKQVPSPANAYNDVLPAAVNDAPDYAYLVEKVVSHTGLERGCEIELRYHIENKADFIPWMWGDELFAARYPIRQMRVIVEVPATVDLKYEWLNSTGKPNITQAGAFRRYTWESKELPALSGEDFHPAFEEMVPRLVFSTCPSWQALREYLHREISKSLTIDLQDRQIFGEWFDAVDPLAKILQWRRCISERLKTIALEPSWLGFRVAPLSRVIARGYAQEIEKAMLLVDLAQWQNISAELLLVSPWRSFAASVPTPLPFTKTAIAVATPSGKKLYVPTSTDMMRLVQEEYPGGIILSLQDHEQTPKSLADNSKDELCLKANFKLTGANKIEGQLQLSTKGYFLSYFQLLDAEGQKAFTSSAIKQILPEGKLDAITISFLDAQQLILTANYQSEEFFKKLDYPSWYACAGINSVFDPWRQAISLNRRSAAVVFPAAPVEEIELTIDAPDSVTWLAPNRQGGSKENVYPMIRNKVGEFFLDIKCQGNQLNYHRRCALKENPIPTEHYQDLKTLLTVLYEQNIRTFYFTQGNKNK